MARNTNGPTKSASVHPASQWRVAVTTLWQNKEFGSGLLARLDSNGQLDTSFGGRGVAVLLAPLSQLALLSNGQILASSASSPVQGVTRYNSNRSVDHTFGSLGQGGVTAFPGMNIGGTATVAFETNGDIVAAGNAGFAPSNQSQFTSGFALARYLSGGRLDTPFGHEAGLAPALAARTSRSSSRWRFRTTARSWSRPRRAMLRGISRLGGISPSSLTRTPNAVRRAEACASALLGRHWFTRPAHRQPVAQDGGHRRS